MPPSRVHPKLRGEPREDGPGAGRRHHGTLAIIGAGVGAVLFLAVALTPNPMALSRFAARSQAVRAGAEFLGREGLTLQSGLHDCGPAALANLVARLGREAPPLDSLGRLAGTRPSGTRVSGLVRAAAAVGVPLVPWSPPSAANERLPTPSIAWVRRSHFVTVVSRDEGGRLEILDPLVGRYRMSTADFHRIWSGEVLLVVQEAPPLVATPVAALFPLAGGFHATSSFGPAHPDLGRGLRDAPTSGAP